MVAKTEKQQPINSDKTILQQKFDSAANASEYSDDIGLTEKYSQAIEIRMDTMNFYIRHIESKQIRHCSAFTGPRKLKQLIENWIDSIPVPSIDPSITKH